MATGVRKAQTLADWDDATFDTSPPEDVELRVATAEDLETLYAAKPEDVVEDVDFGAEPDAVSKFGYVDESAKLYVGREFTSLERFADWWGVQRFGSLPFNGHGWHHTAIPDRSQWIGLQHLHNTFHYFRTQLGWPAGMGPHVWVRSKRAGKVAGPRIYIGTHPAHDGIGISYRNSRYVHTEFIDRFDFYGYDRDDYDIASGVIRIVNGERGIPLKHCDGTGFDGPSKPMGGWLFHRRSKTNPKTCPGSKVIEGPFEAEVKKRTASPAPSKPTPPPAPSPSPQKTLYRVTAGGKQHGAFERKQGSLTLAGDLLEKNSEVRITKGRG